VDSFLFVNGYTDSETTDGFVQFGQYQGAGVLTGFGLRLRHLAQRKRLPLIAVSGAPSFQSWESSSPSQPQHAFCRIACRLLLVNPCWFGHLKARAANEP
jgi:hypothetical protein